MNKYRFIVAILSGGLFACTEYRSTEEEIEEEVDDIVILDSTFDDILELPETAYNYANPPLPDHFSDRQLNDEDNTPGFNPVTDDGATLGRVLFYDTKLSANNTIACASCHTQEDGFADTRQFSVGFEGGLTGRNSMGLSNAKYYENGSFFWDERASSLEEQTLMPIQDHIEMGLTLEELQAKVQGEEYYQYLFQKAYGDTEVTSERIAFALSQFIRSMISYQSKYDEGLVLTNGDEDDNFSNFSALENLGKNLFMSNRTDCSNCHATSSFVGDRARNNGLDATTTDRGLGATTGDTDDDGKFKTNSLRNIALTTPYMHDGRFETLEEVIEHYNSGIQNHPNLDNRLSGRNNQPTRMNLSDQEKQALVAFLNTLTDPSFISDEKFSDPFIQ